MDQPANQEPREHQEVTAQLVDQERGDFLDLKELTGSPDQRDLLDPQERMVCPDTLDREEKSVSKGRLDLLVDLELSDLRDPQVRPDQWASAATLDPRAPQESRVCLGPLGRREPREILVPAAALARMDPLG